jgi:hypothetical protein
MGSFEVIAAAGKKKWKPRLSCLHTDRLTLHYLLSFLIRITHQPSFSAFRADPIISSDPKAGTTESHGLFITNSI